MEILEPDDCLVIPGVHHHHRTPPDDDGQAFARIAVSMAIVPPTYPDDPTGHLVSVDVYEHDMLWELTSDGDAIERVGSEHGPKLCEFHFAAEGARQLAHQLLAIADGVDLLEAGESL